MIGERSNNSHGLFNISAVIIFFHLLFAARSSNIAIVCSVLYLLLMLFIYYKKSPIWVKYIFTVISTCSFVIALYISHPDFPYITRFVYIIPLLNAISLRDFFSPNISGLGIMFIFFTYIDQVGTDVIKSTTIGLVFACMAYTVNAYLVRQLKQDKEQLYKMSITDTLTGLGTLEHTLKVGQEMLEKGSNVTAILIDLDHFKQFNDTYGHLPANKVLVQFAQLLKRKTSNLNSIVGRLGGDEFVIIIQDYPHLQKHKLSKVLYDAIKGELYDLEIGLDPMKIPFSIGEASSASTQPILDIEELLHMADINMYYNKFKNHEVIIDLGLEQSVLSYQVHQLLQTLAEKDMYTYVHSQYTSKYAQELAEALDLPDEMIKNIYQAGWLHDIGKVLISSNILRKSTRLEQEEYAIIQQHVVYGQNILADLDLSDIVKNAIKYHHERWDGKGYPYEITGKNIPIEGRILKITDSFSAMTVKRVYREQLSLEDAIEEIEQNSGTHFDPYLVKVFIDLLKKKKIAT